MEHSAESIGHRVKGREQGAKSKEHKAEGRTPETSTLKVIAACY